MSINYLYIDDDKTSDLEELIAELEYHSDSNLSITHIQTRPMKEVQSIFLEGKFDGFIIDQRLDAANEREEVAGYWGTSLAQNLRTEMIGGHVPHAPIVLLSNEEVFVQYFNKDESAHNLFDFTLGKTAVSKCERFAHQASHILLGLADAYHIANNEVQPRVSREKNIERLLEPLLRWDSKAFKYSDKRFIEHVNAKIHDPHTLISLILNSLVRSSGMLVTEKVLATRLGIDIEQSSDWESLKILLEEAKYQGVFASIKERWWFSRLEDWWYDNNIHKNVLRALTASERVEAIKVFTGLHNLVEISPKYKNGKQSEKFWVNCIASDTPLDPADALLVSKPDLMPWEVPLYLDPQTTHDRECDRAKYKVHSDHQKKVKALYWRLTRSGE
ncbi:hypothetical protein [Vibrio atlanticus]|uniref:Uncharacterized protein n=1 Tax=Vibrio atlanticus TaxID=693153 RepID=A0A1C3IQ19_9VIBR|nr:hypothetical protein [Vibrio atlanticus]SBS63357.1 hypothetical protein VAT7223_01616 [Vibrio atlanticus]